MRLMTSSLSSANLWISLALASLLLQVAVSQMCSNMMTLGTSACQTRECVSAGDVDNDTYPDLLCGCPGLGYALLIFGRSTEFSTNWDLTQATPTDRVIKIFTTSPSNYGFGMTMSGAGDVNNDGFADFLITATQPNPPTTYLFFGKPSSWWTSNKDIATFTSGVDGIKIYSSRSGHRFVGESVRLAGDFNKDGKKDLIITVSGSGSPLMDNYHAFVIWGRSSWTNIDINTFYTTSTADGIKISGGTNCMFTSVNYAGDLNKDGTDDIAIGCISTEVYILFGAQGITQNINLSNLVSPTQGIVISGFGTILDPGLYVCGIGDVNGDTYDDVVFAAGGPKYHIIFGGSSMASFDLSSRAPGLAVELLGSSRGGGCGYTGDVNSDGYNDVVLNASYRDKLYLVFGGPHLTTAETIDMTLAGDASKYVSGSVPYSTHNTATLDMNKDGIKELYHATGNGYIYQFKPCICNSNQYAFNYICQDCSNLDSACTSCSDSTHCTTCSRGKHPLGATCIACTSSQYWTGAACTECSTLNSDCTSCNDSGQCTACSGGKHPSGSACISCSTSQYWNGVACTECSTLNSDCTSCNDSGQCTACSGGKHPSGSTCISCSASEYWTGATCRRCSTLDSACTSCSDSTHCTTCSGGKHPLGAICIACTSSQYWTGAACTECSTLNSDCTSCNDSTHCTSCSRGKTPQGTDCVCSVSEYWMGTTCAQCSTLNSDCTSCNDSGQCTACSGGKHPSGSTCIYCSASEYWTGTACTECATLDASCTSCADATRCSTCSGDMIAEGAKCIALSSSESELSAGALAGIITGACLSGIFLISVSYIVFVKLKAVRKLRVGPRPAQTKQTSETPDLVISPVEKAE